ncbi:hypothetical protein LB456_09945 [Psychroflexus sp. CAK57W]|uniref:hypothetical protein n=1 Tax=Psychroflexus curvus TaxID=2873595 RepID=UPI001CCDDE5E|nr:hypothetical protein [Psychroflexus curvus]MBZ9628080.1 hypothetical protein [Psychroflexus curvus]MBZ9787779.1 hypothetical protein [Psychroflexus curvus]
MKSLYPLIIRLFAYAGLMFLMSLVIQFDFAEGEVKEDSLIEITQEIILLIGSLLLIGFSSKAKDFKIFNLALAGFLGVHVVREFDFWLNTQLFDKAWQAISLVIVILVLIMVVRNWKKLVFEIAAISKTYGFAFFFSGLVILHVFSRLYGRKLMWIDLLRDTHDKYVIEENGEKIIPLRDFMRPVKDASEESIELLAYSIMLIGVVEMIIFGIKSSRKIN